VLRAAVLAASLAALAVPAAAPAYGWPVKPFDGQHAIRGGFDDPRERPKVSGDGWSHAFHFGVDIVASGGTPVYAVAPGTVFDYPEAVAVRRASGHEFSYWHVVPAQPEHSYVTTGQLLGWVKAGWRHVHFAEWDGSTYVNPLRPGALTPYSDTTVPVVSSVELRGRAPPGETAAPVDLAAVTGVVDVVAVAYDPPPLVAPPPWEGAVVAPAVIRWRLLGPGGVVVLVWRTAVDFSVRWLSPSLFSTVYAPDTRQNRPGVTGHYAFWLMRRLDTSGLPPGDYRIEVQASDVRGNTGAGSLDFAVWA
jgi:hypothetical protein